MRACPKGSRVVAEFQVYHLKIAPQWPANDYFNSGDMENPYACPFGNGVS
jgi:hypothetical protein